MAKERERREKTVAKAQAALDDAKAEHDATTRAIEAERAALDKRAKDEKSAERSARKSSRPPCAERGIRVSPTLAAWAALPTRS